jgi:hypothetical protein
VHKLTASLILLIETDIIFVWGVFGTLVLKAGEPSDPLLLALGVVVMSITLGMLESLALLTGILLVEVDVRRS